MFNKRTDLAVEAREMYREEKKQEIPGVEVDVTEKEGVKVTRVNIREEVGARIMGKPVGNYITIEANGLKQRTRMYTKRPAGRWARMKRIAPWTRKAPPLWWGLETGT